MKMRIVSEETAREVLETVPSIMRAIRAEMRAHRAADLSVPQFRALAFLNRHPGASLSELADHIGLSLPSASKLMDGLVARKLATREMHAGDRRRITLVLTARGRATLEAARRSTQSRLAERLSALSGTERAAVVRAMHILRPIFVRNPAPQVATARRRNSRS